MSAAEGERTVIAQFVTEDGEKGDIPEVYLPADVTPAQLAEAINQLLKNEEEVPYAFYVNDTEVTGTLDAVMAGSAISSETVVPIVYTPQAVFRVRSVTRCTSSLPGHTAAILSVQFSPDGTKLASASGDTTVRLWDLNTEMPGGTMSGHKNWVLFVSWSPDGRYVASGDVDGALKVWDGETGEPVGRPLKGHGKAVTSIAWEPLHLTTDGLCRRFVSSSKDATAKIWDVTAGRCVISLSGHTNTISCVKWGGSNLIFTASHDRTIKVWTPEGKLVRTLQGHGHWVNTLALNTDYVMRTGAIDHTGELPETDEAAKAAAQKRYDGVVRGQAERLISGSDDFTLILWAPAESKKPISRLTGHQQPVNHLCFSPDGRFFASASFDKSVRLWDGTSGKYVCALRNHVGAVYMVGWSSDSRMLISASKDSTLKVWDVKTRKMKFDLPGHADEVYAVDWSPDGQRVASGSKDKLLKIWRA